MTFDRAHELAADLRDRRTRFADWRRRLAAELAELPDTLQTFREGTKNFQVVTARLAESSDVLEQLTKVYEATLADTTRRSAQAVQALRSQIDSLAAAGSPDRVMSLLGEMQRTIESIAELNPLWPRRRPH